VKFSLRVPDIRARHLSRPASVEGPPLVAAGRYAGVRKAGNAVVPAVLLSTCWALRGTAAELCCQGRLSEAMAGRGRGASHCCPPVWRSSSVGAACAVNRCPAHGSSCGVGVVLW